jgi:hypothetical protein
MTAIATRARAHDEMPMGSGSPHVWQFRARFRRNAFGWRSQPAVLRVRQAVGEIKKVARRDPMLAADGAITLLERLSPALERVDSSSGAIGTAVNNAIAELVPIMSEAPADARTRERWLERLWLAHEADQIPYIEVLADYWGELCVSKEVASRWADRLIGATRRDLGADKRVGAYFHGTSACLSAMYSAGRYEELIELVAGDQIWHYKSWGVRALAAMGSKSEAIRYAEDCRSPWTTDAAFDRLCEEILLSSGLVDEAYRRYGLSANRGPNYLATFRALVKKYPHQAPPDILRDLVASTPGEEGKWFAAAKELGLYQEALALAGKSPCDPKTLTRASRDLVDKEPEFALSAGLLALDWLVKGYGYEITGGDVWMAYTAAMNAAARLRKRGEIQEKIKQLVTGEHADCSVRHVLGREVGV